MRSISTSMEGAAADVDTQSVGSELQWTRRCCGGILKDVRRRGPYYKSDFVDAFKGQNFQKTTSSISFLLFACIAPAIAFGGMFAERTDGYIGVVEVLLSSGITGILYSLLSGQPLCIMGGTGPGMAYTVAFYEMTKALDVEFLPARVWQGLWCSLITVVLACTDCCALMSHVTRFVEEIFSALISIIFIAEAFIALGNAYSTRTREAAFLTTLLCFGTLFLAMKLRDVKFTNLLNAPLRKLFSNFGVTIAIFTLTGIAQAFRKVPIAWLDVPEKFEPSWTNPETGAKRPWFINPFGINKDLPVWAMFATIVPGLGMALLNYLDQNLTTLLINRPSSGLKKPVGYHLDLFICGAVIYPICSFFGLPFPCAATVRCLTHLISLTNYEDKPLPGGGSKRVVVDVVEQRWTNFAIHLLITLSLVLSKYLQYVPQAVLIGVFLYMGITSITGNQLFDRIFLWTIFERKRYPAYRFVKRVPHKRLHLFTLFQVVCLAILYALKASKSLAVAFPFYIACLVFVRKGLPWVFTADELAELDAHDELEDEAAPEATKAKAAAKEADPTDEHPAAQEPNAI